MNPVRVFEAVGRALSVTKAAEELNVTPAAVSRQIRTLEEFLGTPLFIRASNRLELTHAGARYLAELTPALATIRSATEALMGGATRRFVLRIRSPATFAVRWLIPRLASFHADQPLVEVRLTTGFLPLDFDREPIDAGIELGSGVWANTHVQRLVPNVLVPVATPTLAKAAKERSPAHFASWTLLHSLARPDDWRHWLQAAGVGALDAYRGMKYETSLLAYQAALEGHGFAMAQAALVARDLADGRLERAHDFEIDRGDHTYYFVWPTGRSESRGLAVFRDWLATVPTG